MHDVVVLSLMAREGTLPHVLLSLLLTAAISRPPGFVCGGSAAPISMLAGPKKLGAWGSPRSPSGLDLRFGLSTPSTRRQFASLPTKMSSPLNIRGTGVRPLATHCRHQPSQVQDPGVELATIGPNRLHCLAFLSAPSVRRRQPFLRSDPSCHPSLPAQMATVGVGGVQKHGISVKRTRRRLERACEPLCRQRARETATDAEAPLPHTSTSPVYMGRPLRAHPSEANAVSWTNQSVLFSGMVKWPSSPYYPAAVGPRLVILP